MNEQWSDLGRRFYWLAVGIWWALVVGYWIGVIRVFADEIPTLLLQVFP